MVYRVLREAQVTRDLDLIEDYLVATYLSLGEDEEGATSRATARIEDAQSYIRSFANHPHRGTEHPRIHHGLRTVTSNRFIYYFEIDEPRSEVRVLAVFFGGVNHQKQILDRLQH